MSLDVYLIEPDLPHNRVFWANTTHNLNHMASLAGCYDAVWRPDENNITVAKQMIKPLRMGIRFMEDNRAECEKLNPENGWGDYDGLLKFLRLYHDACVANPKCKVWVSR